MDSLFILQFLYIMQNDKRSVHAYVLIQRKAISCLTTRVFTLFYPFVLYYSIKVKCRDNAMGTTRDSLLLTTGVAFIRDNFVDYPIHSWQSGKLKLAGCRYADSEWIPAEICVVLHIYGNLMCYTSSAHVDYRNRFDHCDYHSNEQSAIHRPTTHNMFIRDKFDDCSGARWFPRKLKLGQFNCSVWTVGFINRRHGEKESRQRSVANERYNEVEWSE